MAYENIMPTVSEVDDMPTSKCACCRGRQALPCNTVYQIIAGDIDFLICSECLRLLMVEIIDHASFEQPASDE